MSTNEIVFNTRPDGSISVDITSIRDFIHQESGSLNQRMDKLQEKIDRLRTQISNAEIDAEINKVN